MLQQLTHFYTVAYDTFGHLGLSLVVTALLLLPVAASYFFFKVRKLDKWERELVAWEETLRKGEVDQNIGFARQWAQRFPEWAGLSFEKLVEQLPNTTNPIFLEQLFNNLNPTTNSVAVAEDPKPSMALEGHLASI